jgi:hypothetical protein
LILAKAKKRQHQEKEEKQRIPERWYYIEITPHHKNQ